MFTDKAIKGIKDSFSDIKESTKETTEVEDVDGSFKIKASDNNIEDVIEILDKMDNTEDSLDGLLFYDYYNSQNILLFKPKFTSASDSKILVRKIDLFKLKEYINKDMVNNSNFKSKIYTDKMLKDNFVMFDEFITKNYARIKVTNNKKLLLSLGIDISKEDYNLTKNTNYITSITDNDGNEKIYRYDDYKEKWLARTKKYSNILASYYTSIDVYDGVGGDTLRRTFKTKLIKKLVTSADSYKLLDVRTKVTQYGNYLGAMSMGIPGSDSNVVLPDKNTKFIPKIEYSNYFNEMKNKYGIDIRKIYERTCLDKDRTLLPIFFKQYFSSPNDIVDLINASTLYYQYFIPFDELIVNYLGNDNWSYNELNPIILKVKDYENKTKRITEISKEMDKIVDESSVGQIGSRPSFGGNNTANENYNKLYEEKDDSMKALDITDEQAGLFLYYYKIKAVLAFIELLSRQFEPVIPASKLDETIMSKKPYQIEFFKVLINDRIGEEYSYEEYKVLNSFFHAYADRSTFASSYDMFSFNPKIFAEITESQKEKMGMYIDTNIEKDNMYLYQILQKEDDTLFGDIK